MSAHVGKRIGTRLCTKGLLTDSARASVSIVLTPNPISISMGQVGVHDGISLTQRRMP